MKETYLYRKTTYLWFNYANQLVQLFNILVVLNWAYG